MQQNKQIEASQGKIALGTQSCSQKNSSSIPSCVIQWIMLLWCISLPSSNSFYTRSSKTLLEQSIRPTRVSPNAFIVLLFVESLSYSSSSSDIFFHTTPHFPISFPAFFHPSQCCSLVCVLRSCV